MELQMVAKSWKYITDDKGRRKIAGTYAVKCGSKEIATKEFNDGYSSVEINFPATLEAKIEAIDAEVRQAIIDSFTK
jgi:hypothetical protein